MNTPQPVGDDDFTVVHIADAQPASGQVYGAYARVGASYQVYIARDALKRALRHAQTGYAESGREVAGALIGSLQRDETAGVTFVEINEAVPVEAASVNYDVQIDPLEWSRAQLVTQEPQFRGRAVIVGWYHSHANIGVFLSGGDLRIQALNFDTDWQTAIVIDPARMEIGAFHGAGTPCPLYVIPAKGDTALIPAAAVLAHLDDPPRVVTIAAWRSPFVLAATGILVLALIALAGLFLNARSNATTIGAAATAAAATSTYIAYQDKTSGEATQTIGAIYQAIDARGFATLTAAADTADQTAVAIQTQALADLATQTGSFYATATAQVVAVQTALASANSDADRQAIGATATALAGAANATQVARQLQVTTTSVAIAHGTQNNAVQQTAIAGVTATHAAVDAAVAQTAVAAAAAAAARQTAAALLVTPTAVQVAEAPSPTRRPPTARPPTEPPPP